MTVLFLRASLAESPTKERTHREERPMERSQITYPRWCGVEVESHTPESPQVAQQPRQGSKEYTHRWIGCLDPSWMPANVRTRPHSPHMPVAVCLLPPPVLLLIALKHAPRPRLPGQLEPKVSDGGWGGGAKVDPVLPAHANWGHHVRIWDTDGGGSTR